MLRPRLLVAAVACVLVLGLLPRGTAQAPTPLLTKTEPQLLEVLKREGASHKDKADACLELSVLGTRSAVPALVALLADEKMAHMARYALETIPDPSVNEALREQLGQLKGRLLVGVVGSLGVRKDLRAVKPLAALLGDADPDVAQAAARALGSIGTADAAKAIQQALPATSAGNRLAFHEGLFRGAEALAANGQTAVARQLYDALRADTQAAQQVRVGALRGAILTGGREGLKTLSEALRADDYVLFAAAVRSAQELKDPGVTSALTKELKQLSEDRQVVVLQTLGLRADKEALPVILERARGGTPVVRVAAVRALPMVGSATVIGDLLTWAGDPTREVAQAALEGAAALPGPDVDRAILARLKAAEPAARLQALELIARRRMVQSVPAVLSAAGDADAGVRAAALRRAGELGSPAELPALLDLLTKAGSPAEIEAAEQALASLATRTGAPAAGPLVTRLAQADPARKAVLLRVLGAVGGAEALGAVRGALKDNDAEVRQAALRTLSDWKTADAAPDLLAVAKSASSPNEKRLGLRGFLGFASNPETPAAQRLVMCRQAAEICQSVEDKKLLLGALGSIKEVDALGLVVPHLEGAETQNEAGAAVVAIAEELLKGDRAAKAAPLLIEPLEKVSGLTGNPDLARRAKAQLDQARAKAAR